MIALLNAVVGPLLSALVDNRLGAGTRLLTHVGQSRQLTTRRWIPSAQDRAPLSWTSERADTLLVCEERKAEALSAILASGASNRTLREQAHVKLTFSQLEVMNW